MGRESAGKLDDYGMSMKIEKKILPEYFRYVRRREKTFELRKDDEGYQVGDILVLREWDGKEYTGCRVTREITYILRNVPDYGLKEGFCILGIQPVGWREEQIYATADGDCL